MSTYVTAIRRFRDIGLLVLLGACSTSPPPTASVPSDPQAELGLRPGDVVRVAVWREEDLSGEFPVDDRGVVTLPLLGERPVEGVDPAELRARLLTDYREFLRNPSIEVTALRRITILGAVNAPGLYPVDATVALSEAIGLAGGISPTGDADDIRVVRDSRVVRSDLDQATLLATADIRSGDQIIVGERSWLDRNSAALLGSIIAASAVITTALIR